MGDYFDSFLQEELRSLAVSRSQLGEWEPVAVGRGKRR
jgi:hypothetical protein